MAATASCKFSHNIVIYTHHANANDGCKTCASVAGLVASFIVVVIVVLLEKKTGGTSTSSLWSVTIRTVAPYFPDTINVSKFEGGIVLTWMHVSFLIYVSSH